MYDKDDVDYLLADDSPVVPTAADLPTSGELAQLPQHGGAFDWLEDEPELYSIVDGEPM